MGALAACGAALLTAALAPGGAAAQEGAGQTASNETEPRDLTELSLEQLLNIVVTAQKREEKIQDVPIAITVFTADALAAKNIDDVQRLSDFTPNVTFTAGSPASGSTSVLSAYIRGIGQDDFAFNVDTGVGVYVDGVYLARSVGANSDLLDVARVEILKGPQGTLFGRNTIGGAISIITRDPGTEYRAVGEVTTGSYNRFDARGSIDIPFSPNLRSSLAFSVKTREGYMKRVPFPAPRAGSSGIPDCDLGQAPGTPCAYLTDPPGAFVEAGTQTSSREGGQNEWNMRGKLFWDISPSVQARIAGDYTRVDQSATPNTLLVTATAPGDGFGYFYNLCISTPAPVLAAIGLGLVCGPRATVGSSLAGVNVDGNPNNDLLPYDNRFVTGNIDTSYATGASFSKLTNYGFSATIDAKLGAETALKSISAYRKLSWSSGMDLDGSPATILEPSFRMSQHQFSQELQLTGNALGGRLRYVVGGYYSKETGSQDDFLIYPAGLVQIYAPNTFSTRALAGYANLDFRFTSWFSITLGGRYTREDKALEGGQAELNALSYKIAGCYPPSSPSPAPGLTCQQFLGFPVPGQPLRLFPAGVNKQAFQLFTPRVVAEFRPSDDVMVYGSYSQGSKSGGWTTRLSSPIADASMAAFGPEKADTYELGVKSELFDRRARLGAAAFYTLYKDIQLTVLNGPSPTLGNVGEAEIYGAEAELQVIVTPALSIDTSVGYIHDRYTKLDPNVVGVSLADKLPKTPTWKINIAPRYVVRLTNAGSILLDAAYTHTSSLYNVTENLPLVKRQATDILGASITYREPRDRWALTVGGANILNDRYFLTGFGLAPAGVFSGTYSPPAEWYVRLRTTF